MPLAVSHLYEFDKFRVDAERGVLLRGDETVSLTTKAFEILLVLIQHRSETVSKDVLLKAVWPDTFVEEANLTQHISMLRKVLGETPQDRRYIATVPGRGYRFVADVRALPESEIWNEDTTKQIEGTTEETFVVESRSRSQIVVQEPKSDGALTAISLWVSRIGKKTRMVLAAVAMVLLACVVDVGWNHLRALRGLGEKDSILLADFENSTGEAVFDGTLKEGMAVELGQSPFLDLASTERVRETLQFMGRSPRDSVQMPVARELCERMGSKALITGSIARLGSAYVIAVEALVCADGTALAREQVEADSKEEVLPVLGKVARRLRAKLGESLTSIQKFDVPMEQATTPSLEALKSYSLGIQQRARGNEKGAIPFFEHAIALDSNFAMAYAQLGGVYKNLEESGRASEFFKKAFALKANLSEREKLYLTVRYHETVTGDIDKATDTYEIWSQIYPRDPRPFNGLAARYQVVGQYEKAAAAARSALALEPGNYVPYANLATSYLSLNRFDQATQTCQQAADARRDSLYTHQVLFEVAFLHHDQAAMEQEVKWAQGTERENDMVATEALALIASGKLASGRQLFVRSWATSQDSGIHDDAAYSMAREALAEADFGNYQQALAQASAALKLGHGIDAEETAAEAFALSGDVRRAQALVEDLRSRFPGHTVLNHASLPSTMAAIELQRQNPSKAIELLQQAEPYDLSEFASLSPVYIRGQAYLRANRGKEAVEQFQRILDQPGIDVTSQRHNLSQLGLARAFVLAGNVSQARTAYNHFFSLWSSADDVPVLRVAKQEYEKLR